MWLHWFERIPMKITSLSIYLATNNQVYRETTIKYIDTLRSRTLSGNNHVCWYFLVNYMYSFLWGFLLFVNLIVLSLQSYVQHSKPAVRAKNYSP